MTLLQYDNSLNQSYKSSVLDGLASGLGWLLHLSLALGRPYLFPRGIQSGACDSNLRSKTEHVEKALKHIIYSASNKLKGKELDLILVILPDNNGSLYGDLK